MNGYAELRKASTLVAKLERQNGILHAEQPWIIANQLRRLVALCEAGASFCQDATQLPLGESFESSGEE